MLTLRVCRGSNCKSGICFGHVCTSVFRVPSCGRSLAVVKLVSRVPWGASARRKRAAGAPFHRVGAEGIARAPARALARGGLSGAGIPSATGFLSREPGRLSARCRRGRQLAQDVPVELHVGNCLVLATDPDALRATSASLLPHFPPRPVGSTWPSNLTPCPLGGYLPDASSAGSLRIEGQDMRNRY